MPHLTQSPVVSGYIMRALLTVFGLLNWTLSFGQNCFCDKNTMLKEIINCDKIKFDNKSSLYWSFNCDSSWLTFESPTHQKDIIFSLGDGLQELTGRLGYIYATEYRHTFLIQCNVISGCCTPPDFYLFDKTTGQIKDSLGTIIFYSADKKLPFVLSIKYSETDANNFNFISIHNIDKSKTFLLKLPKGEIEKALKKTEEIYPEYLFDKPILKGTTIYLTYLLDRPKNEKVRHTKTITIDLKKYSR